MAKKKKFCEQVIEVNRGTGNYTQACDEIKHRSGFSHCLPLNGKLMGEKVEHKFLLGDDLGVLKGELFQRQMEAEKKFIAATTKKKGEN